MTKKLKRFEHGRALIVGNNAYVVKRPLKQCARDADLLKEQLRATHFPGEQTRVEKDVDRETMFDLVDELADSTQNGSDCTWMHFSGHGETLNIDGQYDVCLAPVTSKRPEDNLSLRRIMDRFCIRKVEAPVLHIITLDCCQEVVSDNTRGGETKSIENAMEDVRASRGGSTDTVYMQFGYSRASNKNHEFLIFFAGAERCLVDDTGVFSREIAAFLERKDSGLFEMCSEVAKVVKEKSHQRQQPNWWNVGLSHDYLITQRTAEGQATVMHEVLTEALPSLPSCSDEVFKHLKAKVHEEDQRRKRKRKRERAAQAGSVRVPINRARPPRQMMRSDDSEQRVKRRWELIICDGNIGCGKTTFLEKLRPSIDVDVRLEPVKRDAENSWWDLLVDLYERMQNAQNEQQKLAAAARLEDTIWSHHRAIACNRSKHTISERGLRAAANVFSKILFRNNMLTEWHYNSLVQDYGNLKKSDSNQPSLTIYFRVPVQEAKHRIEDRATKELRVFERNIDTDYLDALHQEYERIYPAESDRLIIVDSIVDSRVRQPDEILQEVRSKLADKLNVICSRADYDMIMQCLSGANP